MPGDAITISIAPTGQTSAHKTVADALVPVHDDGLASYHPKDVTFRTDRNAGRAADTVFHVDVWMLGARAIGVQLPFSAAAIAFASTFFILARYRPMKKLNTTAVIKNATKVSIVWIVLQIA